MNLPTIAKNSAWYLGDRLIRLLGSFCVLILLARTLAPSDYGAFALALAICSLFGFVGSLGIESIALRELTKHQDRVAQIASSYMLLRFVGAIVGLALAFGYTTIAHPQDQQLKLLVLILSFSVVFATLDVVDLILQSQGQAKLTASTRTIAFTASALLKCILIIQEVRLEIIAISYVVEFVLVAIRYFFISKRMGYPLKKEQIRRIEIRKFLIDGRYMILSGIVVTFYSKLDVLAIGYFLPLESVATYALAASLCGAWAIVGMSTSQAFAPHITRAMTKSRKDYLYILRFFFITILNLAIAGSLTLYIFGNYLLIDIFGKKYQHSIDILNILAWISIPSFLGIATSQIIVNENLYLLSFQRTFLGLFCTLALIGPIAISYDIIGVAWLVLGSSCLVTISIFISNKARHTIYEMIRGH